MLYRRSPIEQLLDVLEATSKDHVRTHIMYKSNESWDKYTYLSNILLEHGYIMEVEGGYAVTPKGYDILVRWQFVKEALGVHNLKDIDKLP